MIYSVMESDIVFQYNTNRNGKMNERKEFLWIGCWK